MKKKKIKDKNMNNKVSINIQLSTIEFLKIYIQAEQKQTKQKVATLKSLKFVFNCTQE